MSSRLQHSQYSQHQFCLPVRVLPHFLHSLVSPSPQSQHRCGLKSSVQVESVPQWPKEIKRRERVQLEHHTSNKPSSTGHTTSWDLPWKGIDMVRRSCKRGSKKGQLQRESQTEEKHARGAWKRGMRCWMASQRRASNHRQTHDHFEADCTTTRTSRPTAGGFSSTCIHYSERETARWKSNQISAPTWRHRGVNLAVMAARLTWLHEQHVGSLRGQASH